MLLERGPPPETEVAAGCPMADGLARGRPGGRAVLGAPGPTIPPFFQERIFLTVSNYIFTAIFVGEMTLKVAPSFTWDPLPPPAWGRGLARGKPLQKLVTHLPLSHSPQRASEASPPSLPARCRLPGWAPGTQRGSLSRSSHPAGKVNTGKHLQCNGGT